MKNRNMQVSRQSGNQMNPERRMSSSQNRSDRTPQDLSWNRPFGSYGSFVGMPSLFRDPMVNPWQGISSLQNSVDRIFDEFLGGISPLGSNSNWGTSLFSPLMNVEEQKDHYLMSFDLPGVKKEDVKIEIQGNQLVVSGERKQETNENERGRRYYECSYGTFERSFPLPAGVTAESVEADFRDGVLTIAVPRVESQTSQTIPIGAGKVGLLSQSGKKEKAA